MSLPLTSSSSLPLQFIPWAATQTDNLSHRQFQLNYLKLFKGFLLCSQQKANLFIITSSAFHSPVPACQTPFLLLVPRPAPPPWCTLTLSHVELLSVATFSRHPSTPSLSLDHSSEVHPPPPWLFFKTQVFCSFGTLPISPVDIGVLCSLIWLCCVCDTHISSN